MQDESGVQLAMIANPDSEMQDPVLEDRQPNQGTEARWRFHRLSSVDTGVCLVLAIAVAANYLQSCSHPIRGRDEQRQ